MKDDLDERRLNNNGLILYNSIRQMTEVNGSDVIKLIYKILVE